jgi:murein DD-endopeptidase MepM/ murein hydrolase activator NlpD
MSFIILKFRFISAFLILFAAAGFGIFWMDEAGPQGLIHHEEGKQPARAFGPEVPLELRIERFEGVFPPNSTLQDLLLQYEFDSQQIHQLILETKEVHNLNKVKAGNGYLIERFENGPFRKFRYDIDDESAMIVDFRDGHYEASVLRRQLRTDVVQFSAGIEGNLWNTLINRGESGLLTMNIFELMQWDIAFTAVQPYDSFKLIYEKKFDRDEFIKYGVIHALVFNHEGKNFYAFRFKDPVSGKQKYYDFKGKNVKKAFLKIPLQADYRISSGFSYSRLHPVLRRRLPHYGVDYAAPRGTPVLASAAGKVVFAARKGGNGNLVKIRHANGYTTYYLHLSKILVRKGQYVDQGHRIGRVGATGIATGPHLDYRIQTRSGKFINPRKFVALPTDKGVDPKHMEDFIAVRDAFLLQLDSIPNENPQTHDLAVAG